MAAEALHKHFQQHPKRYRPRDENFDVTGDFTKTKFNSRKSNIYVHEFFNVVQNSANWESHQNQLHRNLYSHEQEIGHPRPHKSDRIRSRSFQDSYISNPHSSSLKYEETPTHTFSNSKAQAVLKSRNAITKLEESYWAHWRPNKSEAVKPRKSNKAHYRVIKKPHPPPQKAESSLSSTDEDVDDEEPNELKEEEQEQQVVIEELKAIEEPLTKRSEVELQVKKSEEIQVPADLSETGVIHKEEENKPQINEEADEVKPLKHTDSFILTAKRQSEEKPHYQQPRCIKLFRKPMIAGSGGSIVRGGSYPLKSSLKKEKTTIKGNIRLGRPGSPITVQTHRRKGI